MNSSAASVMVLIHARPSRRPGPVVLPAERDAALVEGDEAAVGDGDAVGVARQVGEHRLGSGEGPLGVDDPLGGAAAPGGPRRRPVGERRQIAEEGEPAGAMGRGQPVEEQPAEQAREHAHGQEEARPAGDPARAVGREAAAGHDDVHVRVVGHAPSPRCGARR